MQYQCWQEHWFCTPWIPFLPKILVSYDRRKACLLPLRKQRLRRLCHQIKQRRWYNFRSSTTWAFLNSKINIRQGNKDFCCFDIISLPKITLGSRRHRTSVNFQSDRRNLSDPKEYITSGPFSGTRRNCI